MKQNMGLIDRIIRIIIAIVAIALYFSNIITGTLGIVAIVFSVVFIGTSLVSFCPLYTLFGISTCPRK